MPYRWPTDPPGKRPSHSISWQQHQINLARNQPSAPATALLGTPPAKGQGIPPAPAAGAPQAQAPAAGAPAQVQPDAQYLAEAAQRAFQRTTAINEYTEEGKTDRSNTEEAIRRLIADAANPRQTIRENANKQGLFYSGQLTKQLGQFEGQLNRLVGDQRNELRTREDARTRAITALQQGAPLEDAVALAASAQRQVDRDTSAADLNALVPNAVAPPATAPIKGVTTFVNRTNNSRSGQRYRVQAGNGGVWHIYANGKRVWVPRRR